MTAARTKKAEPVAEALIDAKLKEEAKDETGEPVKAEVVHEKGDVTVAEPVVAKSVQPEQEQIVQFEDSKFSVVLDAVRPVFRLTKNGFLGDPFELHVDDIDELIKVLRAAKKL